MLRLDAGLGRIPYLTAGVALFALKYAIDAFVARRFSHTHSILDYVSPAISPLFRPSESQAYWFTMWAVALPFIAVGMILTIRRLRDAGLPPLLALLFFAPFANLVFFVFCALLPGRGAPAKAGTEDAGGPVRMPYGRAAALAGAAGAAVGLATFAFAVLILKSYGATLFVGAPPIGGFVAGLAFARWHRPRMSGALLAGTFAVILAGLVVTGFGLEGLICLAMALPLVTVGSIIGAGLGCLIQRCAPRAGPAPTAAACLLLPVGLILEALSPLPAPETAPVESALIVNAPVEIVWPQVIAFPTLPPPTEWIFLAGVAAPVGAVIDRAAAGGIRRCLFTTGVFVEPIEVWSPPHELAFSVVSSPDPMREWTLTDGPRPPHLDGYLESTRGQFLLERLPGDRTRLIGRTWYRTNMVPEAYWRLWTDRIVHAIHMRVLRHVAALAEREARDAGEGAARPGGANESSNRDRT